MMIFFAFFGLCFCSTVYFGFLDIKKFTINEHDFLYLSCSIDWELINFFQSADEIFFDLIL